MAHYLQFKTETGEAILLEITNQGNDPSDPISKVGAKQLVEKGIAHAQVTFEKAIDTAIQENTRAFLHAIRRLPEQDQPESMQITFGLKSTLSLGNTSIAAGSGETNYTVTMTWKRT